MTRKIVLSSHFKKDAKKLPKSQLEKVKAVLKKIAAGEKLERKFCDHALVGRLSGFRDCHILPVLVLIYKLRDDFMELYAFRVTSHANM